MPITGNGWELQIKRLGIQQSESASRTYGTYQLYQQGQLVASLAGFICECVGPGENSVAGSSQRIEQGRYPLATQFGRYRTIGYSNNTTTAGDPPMPALALEATGNRIGILIHPGHPPSLYLSSIGCLNPTGPLQSSDKMNFWDSRTRVIALIDSLKVFAPAAFEQNTDTRIPNAWAVIDGEPMGRVPDGEAVA